MEYTLVKKWNVTLLQKDDRDILKMQMVPSIWPRRIKWDFYGSGDIAVGQIKLQEKQPVFVTTTNYILSLHGKQYTITRHLFKSYFSVQDGVDEYKVYIHFFNQLSIYKNAKLIANVNNARSFHWLKQLALVSVDRGQDSQLFFALACFCRFGTPATMA